MMNFKKIPWLVYLRIVLGIGGLGGGLYGLMDPAGQVEKMKLFAETTSFLWYADFLNNVFLPNPILSANLINLISLLSGILLIFGLFIGTGCILGILVSFHWFFGQIVCNSPHALSSILLIILALIVLFSEGSRRYSLDEKIFKRFQKPKQVDPPNRF
jgi:uncharacterized membrane protein YphA (DoxX/SURF4 family)